jgi:hypothetical protein
MSLLSAIKWRETWRTHVWDCSVHAGDSRNEYLENLGFTTLILDAGCIDLVVLSVVDNVACWKSHSCRDMVDKRSGMTSDSIFNLCAPCSSPLCIQDDCRHAAWFTTLSKINFMQPSSKHKVVTAKIFEICNCINTEISNTSTSSFRHNIDLCTTMSALIHCHSRLNLTPYHQDRIRPGSVKTHENR